MECKKKNALPIHANNIYIWAIRPDGTVLCIDHEAFGLPCEPETDQELIREALVHGAIEFPELTELAQSQPPAEE